MTAERAENDGIADTRAAGRGADTFRGCYGGEPEGVWFAPGRVNLIGEHTDYNEGFVLPFAISQGVVAAASRRADAMLALRSRQAPGAEALIPLDGLASDGSGAGASVDAAGSADGGGASGWAAYPAGVAWALREAGYAVGGASIAIDSDLPEGAGLSSSAALECAVALALTDLWLESAGPTRTELAAIARRAENDFVGVPTGIMDQSASLLCQAGHALLLDCRSLETEAVPFDPAAAGTALLVINTRAKHELTGGDYGNRRAECEEAARLLGVPSLRSVTDPQDADKLDDPVLRRRVRHIVTDNARVLSITRLLRSASPASGISGNFGIAEAYREIGRLLTEAHASLRDDFEISWPEADVTVEAAVAVGALGARMVGGGFGGSVIALVPAEYTAAVRDSVSAAFEKRSWASPAFIDAVPSPSAHVLRRFLP